MICASVPLWKVSAHLDATLGDDIDTSPSRNLDSLLREVDSDAAAESLEPVFLLTSARTSLRRAA